MTPPEPSEGRPTPPSPSPRLARAARPQLAAAADAAWVMMVELLTAAFVWAGIGWLLDRWLGTTPWMLAIGAVVGWGTGIYLAWLRHDRLVAQQERSEKERRGERAPPSGDGRPTTEGTAGGGSE